MSDTLKPRLDAFTAAVVNDPTKPQGTLLLQGFLGVSSQPDHTRVYSDLTLETYVDVANADIIHTERIPQGQSPMGGSYLWVKKDADVYSSTPAGPGVAKAKFLQGPITTEGAVAQPQLQGWIPHTQAVMVCYPHHTYHPPYACALPQIVNQPQAGIKQPQHQAPITSPAVTCHVSLFDPLCRPTYDPMTCAPTYLVGCHPHAGFQQFAVAPAQAANPALVRGNFPPPTHFLTCPTVARTCARLEQFAAVAPQAVNVTLGGFCPSPLPACAVVDTVYNCVPSFGGFACPSVNQFECPSVAPVTCPSLHQAHCPSVNHFDCPTNMQKLC